MKNLLGVFIFWILIIHNGFSQTQVSDKTAQSYAEKKKAALAEMSSSRGGSSSSDCGGSVVLCGGIYTEETAPPGTGSVYEFTGTCNQGTETMSLWYTFTVAEAGTISFIIDPAVDADDYDWGLFNITNGGCAGIIAQDGSSPEVGCNSYGSLVVGNGPTGISTANGGVGSSNGPGDTFGPAFNADLQVDSGQTFALVVMNWSNSLDGYTIDFTQSTASIYDASVPKVISVAPQCGNRNFDITFSEALINTSVQLEDFSIIGPDSITIPFDSLYSANPAAYSQTNFTLSLPSSLTEAGSYTLVITNDSENVEDICGNIAIDTSFIFTVFNDSFPEVISVLPQCDNRNFVITFSEALLNTSVQLEDFSIIGPDSITIPFDSLYSANPSVYSQTNFTLSLPSGLTEAGNYTLIITNDSENVEDTCGNIAIDTSFIFTVFDAIFPEVISVLPQCGNRNFAITFNEPLINTSVQVQDFTITSPNGSIIPFNAVHSADSSAYSQSIYSLSLDTSLTLAGSYTLTITNISGNVEDICGNLAVDTSFIVNIIAPVSYDISISNACNGTNGSIEASYLNGGTSPISFKLDDVILDETSGSGLDSGLYVLKVIDGAGCEIEREVQVPNHDIDVNISELQDSLSCANPEVQIQGVEILPAQITEFLWSSITSNGSDSLFSQIQNPTTTLPGFYTLYVTEATSGCRDSASVIIEESELAGIDLKTLQFPNVISPNGDGKNDSWRPYLPLKPDFDVTEIFDTYSLIIYNRWGILVFDSQKEGTKYWITSSETTAGMYYYSVAYKSDCGTIIDDSKQGSILVIK